MSFLDLEHVADLPSGFTCDVSGCRWFCRYQRTRVPPASSGLNTGAASRSSSSRYETSKFLKSQQALESGSGPGGRWFESTRPDQNTFYVSHRHDEWRIQSPTTISFLCRAANPDRSFEHSARGRTIRWCSSAPHARVRLRSLSRERVPAIRRKRVAHTHHEHQHRHAHERSHAGDAGQHELEHKAEHWPHGHSH